MNNSSGESREVIGFPSLYSIIVLLAIILVPIFLVLSWWLSCQKPISEQQVILFDTCIDLLKMDVALLFGLIGGKIAN